LTEVLLQLLLSAPTDIESCSVEEPPAKRQRIFDDEKIIMGEELSDAEIIYAQRLLKEKHPKVNL